MINNSKAIFKLLIFLVIAAFFTFILLYTHNLPKDDDFDSPLNALLALSESKGVISYFKELLEFHSDHRLVYLRLTSAWYTNIFGQYNFQIYTILNCLLLLPIFYFIVKPLIKQQKYWEILILSLVIFTVIYHDALIWAHVSATYTPVLLFAILAIRQICKHDLTYKDLLICLLYCLFCLGVFGNGLFLFVPILIVLLIRKKFKFSGIWFALTVLFGSVYFIGHIRPDYLQGHDYFGAYTGKLLGFFGLMGSQLAVDKFAVNQNIVLGIAIAFFLFFFLAKNVKLILQDNTFLKLTALLLFCLTTLFVITIGRVSKNEDYLYLIQDRYRFYGVFTLAIALTLYFVRYKTNKFVLTILTVVFFISNFWSFLVFKPELDLSYKNQNCSTYNYAKNQTGLFYFFNFEERAIVRFQKFIAAGFFNSPKPTELFEKISKCERTLLTDGVTLKEQQSKITFNENLTIVNEMILFDYPTFTGSSHRLNGCYFLFESDENSYIFPSMPNPHQGRNILKNGIGVKATVRRNFLKEGTYKIAVVEVEGNQIRAVRETQKAITI